MAITDLYGIRITDRVTVTQINPTTYQVFFDGEYIGTDRSGVGAVNLAREWLSKRNKERELEAARAQREAEQDRKRQDNLFVVSLAAKLKIEPDDLEELISVIKRRIKADDD